MGAGWLLSAAGRCSVDSRDPELGCTSEVDKQSTLLVVLDTRKPQLRKQKPGWRETGWDNCIQETEFVK